MIDRKGKIKKVSFHFALKLWWKVVSQRLILTSEESTINWDKATMISIIIVGYDTTFLGLSKLRYIRDHLQQLCNKAGVEPIQDIDHMIKVTHMADVGITKHADNPIALQQAQPFFQ